MVQVEALDNPGKQKTGPLPPFSVALIRSDNVLCIPMTAKEWVIEKLTESPRTFRSLVDDPSREHKKHSLVAAAKAIGCGLIRTAYGEHKRVYWTINNLGQRRWICCEFTPIRAVHCDWTEQILAKLGYEPSKGTKEIPEPKTWFVCEGRYYWTEEGPCPRGWREDSRSHE